MSFCAICFNFSGLIAQNAPLSIVRSDARSQNYKVIKVHKINVAVLTYLLPQASANCTLWIWCYRHSCNIKFCLLTHLTWADITKTVQIPNVRHMTLLRHFLNYSKGGLSTYRVIWLLERANRRWVAAWWNIGYGSAGRCQNELTYLRLLNLSKRSVIQFVRNHSPGLQYHWATDNTC